MIIKEIQGRKTERTKDFWFFLLLIAWPVIQFCIFYIFVNFNSIRIAFIGNDGGFTFNNFGLWFTTNWEVIGKATLQSLKYFAICTAISIPLACLFSYYVYSKLHGSSFFKVVLFLPNILSSIVLVIIYNYFVNDAMPAMLKDFFNINQTISITNIDQRSDILIMFFYIWFGFGTTVLIFSNAMSGISPSLNEAMKLDGAGPVTEFFHLIIPSVWPTISMFIVTALAALFVNQYNIMTFFGGSTYDGTVGYYIYDHVNALKASPESFELNQLSALGIICTLISIPLTFGVKNLLEKLGPKDH